MKTAEIDYSGSAIDNVYVHLSFESICIFLEEYTTLEDFLPSHYFPKNIFSILLHCICQRVQVEVVLIIFTKILFLKVQSVS